MLQLKPFLAKFGFVTDENEPSDRLFFAEAEPNTRLTMPKAGLCAALDLSE